MINRVRRTTVLSALLTTAAGCGGSLAEPDAVPTRIEVTPSHVVLEELGADTSFAAIVYDAQGQPRTDLAVSWSSSNPNVATVTGGGGVVAVGPGSASITASAQGVRGSASLDVTLDVTPPELRSVSVDKAQVNVLGQAGLVTVTAELSDEGAGVALAVAQFEGPTGAPITGLVTFDRIAGSPQNGTYRTSLTIAANSTVGTWKLLVMRADDAQGNVSTWGKEALQALGLEVSFEVVWTGE